MYQDAMDGLMVKSCIKEIWKGEKRLNHEEEDAVLGKILTMCIRRDVE